MAETLDKPVQIHIVTPAIYKFGTVASLKLIGPAFDTGVGALRQSYPQYKWTSIYLFNETYSTCLSQQDNVQEMLSRWYYSQSDQGNINVIITLGESRLVSIKIQRHIHYTKVVLF